MALFLFPFFHWLAGKKPYRSENKKEGPNLHLYKENTPSMGGMIIVLSGLLVLSLFQKFTPQMWIILITLLSFGGLGLLDDYFKCFRGSLGA